MQDRVRSPASERGQDEPLSGVVGGAQHILGAAMGRHRVQFYESDEVLQQVVTDFFMQAFGLDAAVLAIVTPSHRHLFREALTAQGVDVDKLSSAGRLTFLDAEATLAQFMDDSLPDWNSFKSLMGEAIEGLRARSQGPIHAYAEMMDVLWSNGKHAAAIRLEEMWHDLQKECPFALACAYVVASFYKRTVEPAWVCATHTQMPPTRPPPASSDATNHGRLNGSQLDSVRSLEAEIQQRQGVEAALRDCLRSSRHAEAELRTNQRQIGAITDAIPLLIAYVDREFRYRFVNLEYERWVGRAKENLLGRRVDEVLGTAVFSELHGHMQTALSGQKCHYNTRLQHTALGERSVRVTYIPHHGPQHQIEGFVAVVADETERVEMEAARHANNVRSERLMKITAALVQAVSPEQVYEAVVDQVASTLGASSAGLYQLRTESQTVHLVHATGYAEQSLQALRCVPLDASPSFPALDAIRSAKPLWFNSQAQLLEAYSHLSGMVTPGRSYQIACLPIVVQDRILGSLGFTFDNTPPLDVEQQDILLLVTRYCGQALERLRLLDAERQNRAHAEAAAARASLLSQASKAFSEAGANLPQVLQAIVKQITAEYAELCAVTLVSGDTLAIEALYHRDPDSNSMIRAAVDAVPLRLTESASGKVVLTGEALFLPTIDVDAALARAAPEYRTWLEQNRPHSAIIAPLRGRDRVLGTLLVVREQGSEAFTQQDVDFLEELAVRAASAIDNSILHRENVEARRRTELLYGLARAVIAADHIEQVFEAALDALEQALDARRSSILTFDADKVMRFNAWRGLSDDYRRAVEGHSPWSHACHEPEPIFVDDAQHDPAMVAYHELFAKENIGALGFIPLVAAGQLVGKFMVYYDEPRQLTAHELNMAKAIANHVAAAVARFTGMAELQRTVRFNEMFAAILGHDLRNPLGAIMASAQLALRRDANERLTKPLARIVSSGERMTRMIDQLLDFTRVRVGAGIPIELAPLDLTTLLRQVMDELEGAHPDCRLQLDPLGDTNGSWDADRLSQVFSNLVGNAVQHGSLEQPVRVRVDGRNTGAVQVEVSNAGCIPKNLLPRLFEPMAGGEQRLQKSRGLGLGLFITRQIIKAHGGSIEVRSSEDQGTTFTAHLPRTSSEAQQGMEQ